jgi:hypothetical protein
MTRKRLFKYVLLIVPLGMVITAVVMFVNPWNWGIDKSERFTEAKFNAIQNGEPIASVVRRLGKPLAMSKNVGLPSKCAEGECDMYAFTGKASPWVFSYREAWVFADHTGRVVHKVMNVEPY